jgi:hypothetical protein
VGDAITGAPLWWRSGRHGRVNLVKIFEELGRDNCRWPRAARERRPVADCGLPGDKGAFLFCGEAVVRKGASEDFPRME